MIDRIVTVTLNPSIDATLWLPRLDFNEPVICREREDYPGGKGINVSRVLTSIGIKNLAVGIVGADNEKKLLDLLSLENVNCNFISNPGAIRENLSIIFPNKRLMKINFEGFEVLADTLEHVRRSILSEIAGAKAPLVVFAGSLPRCVSKEQYASLINSAKSSGASIALDNNFFSADELREIRPDIIKPNHVELASIFELESIPTERLMEYALKLSDYVPHVLLSMGRDGLLYCSNEVVLKAIVPPVTVKSTIGAGDSTLAGFIASLFCGDDVERAVLHAAACGTASVQLEGTKAITVHHVLDVIDRIKIVHMTR